MVASAASAAAAAPAHAPHLGRRHHSLTYIVVTNCLLLPLFYLWCTAESETAFHDTLIRLPVRLISTCMHGRAMVERVLHGSRWILAAGARDLFILQSILTFGALSWLLHRAWQTLWKPVPELIGILGIEVPEIPQVALARIQKDAVTLLWTKPAANRPVLKYWIQVNGVNVGESSRSETAITITGLKPGHFYNVTVIAVSPNNFQTRSKVIRLRTYGRDGLPLSGERPDSPDSVHEHDTDGSVPHARHQGVMIEPIHDRETALDKGSNATAPASAHFALRRSSGSGRKRSTSNAASEQELPVSAESMEGLHWGMQELTGRLEEIRRETEELTIQNDRECHDVKMQMEELTRERDEKKQILKEKEEASERLKKEVQTSERANRQAQSRKTQKEKLLRDKETETAKMLEEMARWKVEIDNLKASELELETATKKLVKDREAKSEELRVSIRQRQKSIQGLEEAIRVKGLQLKKLEESKRKSSGDEHSDAQGRLAAERQKDLDWDTKQRDWNHQIHAQNMQLRALQIDYVRAQASLESIRARQESAPGPDASSSGIEIQEPGGVSQFRSRPTTNRFSLPAHLRPDAHFDVDFQTDRQRLAGEALGATDTLQFAGMHDLSAQSSLAIPEAERFGLTAGAPLSPTATNLLPSNIFADEEITSPEIGSPVRMDSFAISTGSPVDSIPHSPSSSSHSASRISSPRASAPSLPLIGADRDVWADNDASSLRSPRSNYAALGSPASAEAIATRRSIDIFNMPRNRGHTLVEGPALGSLRHTQTQSFPRTGEESHGEQTSRRPSFTSRWNVSDILHRQSTSLEATEGNGPALARNLSNRRRRGFNVFGQSMDEKGSVFSIRDPSEPRPLSTASSDFPRPRTDNAPFGWLMTDIGTRSTPRASGWSVQSSQTWSGDETRRISTRPLSELSSDADILPRNSLTSQTSPPPVGVIGTRPASAHKVAAPKLNPTAPTFKARFGRSSKNKESPKPTVDEQQVVANEISTPASSPEEPRSSRDSHSVHTQESTAESADSLEHAISVGSDAGTSAIPSKDKESSFRQLLRKGSSSKFSFSSKRSRDSGIFGKRGTSSGANSERTDSVERESQQRERASLHHGSFGTHTVVEGGSFKEPPRSWSRAWAKGKKGKGRAGEESERSEAETTGTEDDEERVVSDLA